MTPHLLILVRHAKAMPHDYCADRDRPLDGHGREQARSTGEALAESGLLPEGLHVWCSPSARTRETLEGLQPSLPADTKTLIVESLYEADTALLSEMLRETPEAVEALMIVGHNPTIGEMAHELLSASTDHPDVTILLSGFPTGSAAVFRVNSDWAGLSPATSKLIFHTIP
ncbi:SixA phosphatase family protein [Acidomonas methanolica]|uniref:SixA phosphatase family protein n=1 Tax=Acidomonas methanolica TaxID=437 RepID=UPI00211A2F5B|nr:histidine phosphatase family protein [Acidomonas methanolica]MCQ9154867.1 histidine phosphatase family protein [Acidomonas methanolica]